MTAKPRTAQAKAKRDAAIDAGIVLIGTIAESFFKLREDVGKAEVLLAAVQEDFGAVASEPFDGDEDKESHLYYASAHEWVLGAGDYTCSSFEDVAYENCCPDEVLKPEDIWKYEPSKLGYELSPELFLDWDWGLPWFGRNTFRISTTLEQEMFRAWKQFYPDWKPDEEALRQAESLIILKNSMGRCSTQRRDDLFLNWRKKDNMTDTEIIIAWNKLSDEDRCSICPTMPHKIHKTDKGRDRVKKAILRAQARAAKTTSS